MESTLEAPRQADLPTTQSHRLPRLVIAPGWRPAHRIWLGVLASAVVAVALRIPFIGEPAYSDEGGHLLVARQWREGGSSLYGDLFVDRPPLLMLFWRLAEANGGLATARWLACLGIVGLVACAGIAGWLTAGPRGAVWSSVTASALAATPALGARAVNGELLAIPLLMASCTSTLIAIRRTGRAAQRRWAFAAGMCGVLAMLVKQNFLDALVFAVVLVIASTLADSLSRRSALRVLLSGAAGAGVPVIVTAWWAHTTVPGLEGLWYALYGFRSDASQVILSQSMVAPVSRLWILLGAAAGSGLLAVVACYGVRSWMPLRQGDPLTAAVTTMLAIGLVGIALGGSYWAHYLVGLIPAVSLAVARLARNPGRDRLSFSAVVLVAGSALVTSIAVMASTGPSSPARSTDAALVQVLREASHAADSVVITYGHPHVIERAGLEPAYPYLWSLPLRVLDPRLNRLVRTLTRPSAPTWLIEWESFDAWNIDSGQRLERAVNRHYRKVATVCEATVYLRLDEPRALPSIAARCSS